MESRPIVLHGRFRNQGWIAAVLVIAFAIRAMIPTGFMPMVGPNFTVSLHFCSAYAPIPDVDPHAGHHHHDGGSGTPGSKPGDHATCPFGASPAPAPLLQAAAIQIAAQPDSGPVVFQSPAIRTTTSYRAQSPRGPPILA